MFEAARAGDVETVRRAFASGFDPATPDRDGRTIYQIAKDRRHEAIELLARDVQGADARPERGEAVQGIASAAQSGDVEALRRLDARPDLINALAGRGFPKATALHLTALRNQHAAARLLIERGADLNRREFPDNAAPLHFAAMYADLEMIRLLVEAGADVEAKGTTPRSASLAGRPASGRRERTWPSTCLSHGATLNLWSAIALDKVDEVRAMIARDPALLNARMTRNHHRRTPLHHAAARNRPRIVQLLLELGADPNAIDATGATALTTASQERADPSVVSALLAAGTQARLPDGDQHRSLRRGRGDAARRPSRIGPGGRDTIALHLAVNKQNLTTIRWLIAHGVDVNAKRPMWDCNQTALHMTIESGAMEIAHFCSRLAPIQISVTTRFAPARLAGPITLVERISRRSSGRKEESNEGEESKSSASAVGCRSRCHGARAGGVVRGGPAAMCAAQTGRTHDLHPTAS